ncbi:Protein of unknown function (DUF1279 [Striga hermonthica]|uniref:DUF1279 domain-containing protein n=1 Tax=Striga hermonthica TaxID=68872 RepID=A0A9N7RG18_STRHE|nr:Protein of unknown function (DUF1279 [Striga hermonthica]
MANVLQNPAQCICFSSAPTNGKINRLFRGSSSSSSSSSSSNSLMATRIRIMAVEAKKTEDIKNPSSAADEITKKYGLEVGLWKIFSSKETNEESKDTTKSKGDQAKELLAKYGGAYLATSITLSLISFGLCYFLVSAGVDVPALLHKVGISTDETGEKVGTFALAYAAHKAASPIRFPPTVALTPIVASWIGKKVEQEKV